MKNKWPIIPTQITEYNRLMRNPAKLCLKKGVGLIDNLELKGLLTQMSAEFENPATIVELTKSDSKPLFRTDSGSYKWDLRQTCQILRTSSDIEKNEKCVNCKLEKSFCHTMDNIHVNLFRDVNSKLNPTNLKRLLSDKISSDKYRKKIDYLTGSNSTDIKIRHVNKRYFLQYNCPYFGYRETLFPIFVDSKYFVGLLFVGEILLESHKDNYIEITKKFLNHARDKHLYDIDKVAYEKIIKNHSFQVNNDKFLSSKEYEKKIKQVISKIKYFEERLGEELERKKIKYINDKFESYNREILKLETANQFKFFDLPLFFGII